MLEVAWPSWELFLADLALENPGVLVDQLDVASEGSMACQSLVTGLAIKLAPFLLRTLCLIFIRFTWWTAAGHWDEEKIDQCHCQGGFRVRLIRRDV